MAKVRALDLPGLRPSVDKITGPVGGRGQGKESLAVVFIVTG